MEEKSSINCIYFNSFFKICDRQPKEFGIWGQDCIEKTGKKCDIKCEHKESKDCGPLFPF
jgi:hypothetical protein